MIERVFLRYDIISLKFPNLGIRNNNKKISIETNKKSLFTLKEGKYYHRNIIFSRSQQLNIAENVLHMLLDELYEHSLQIIEKFKYKQ